MVSIRSAMHLVRRLGRRAGRLHRVRTMHRARMQHARVAEYSGEPEREQRDDGARQGGQAIHDPQKIGTFGRRALRQYLVRLTHPGTDTLSRAIYHS